MNVEKLYTSYFSASPARTELLTAAGSSRRYYRLTAEDGRSVIGCEGTDRAENRAFIALARKFEAEGLNAPKILAVSDDEMTYLLSDLGTRSLMELRDDRELLEKAVTELVKFQFTDLSPLVESGEWEPYPVRAFDERSVMWDLNYFKYSFLNPSGVSYDEPELQNEFELMATKLSRAHARTFIYRDFQARNVMVDDDGRLGFIDFQGGRFGPPVYDLVSFVRQARAAYPAEVQERLKDVYFEALTEHSPITREEFDEQYRGYALLRSLQTLGAYGRRGLFERKPHFIASIRPAIEALQLLISTPFEEYPHLMETLKKMIDKELSRLTVTVTSFSFKRGYPADNSGNGGGFVFDCRGLENPGRYEEYKSLTGRDNAVIDFLETKSDVGAFMAACRQLVAPTVETYIKRGFTSLMVSFGCTGGRHRSVYCADRMARRLRELYPEIRIVILHRERQITEEI